MIDIIRSENRGSADHGWLKAKHTFSFADYFDPERVQFGALRVINEDRVAPGQGELEDLFVDLIRELENTGE